MIVIKVKKINDKDVEFYACLLKGFFLKKLCSKFNNNVLTFLDSSYKKSCCENYLSEGKVFSPTTIVLKSSVPLVFNDDKSEIIIENNVGYFKVYDTFNRLLTVLNFGDEEEIVVFIMEDIDNEMNLLNKEKKKKKIINNRVFLKRKSKYNIMFYENYIKNNFLTPAKVIIELGIMLNIDEKSPFYNRINFYNEVNDKKISLNVFCSPLINYMFRLEDFELLCNSLEKSQNSLIEVKNKFSIKNSNKILWKFYVNKKMDILHKIILNYFNAIKKVYSDVWDDENSIINNDIGYNSFMLLFNYVFLSCQNTNNDFSFDYIYKLLLKGKLPNKEFYVFEKEIDKIISYELANKLTKKIFGCKKSVDYLLLDYLQNVN